MYSLHENDIYRLISACRHYMRETSSEHIYDEYSRILAKLEKLEQASNHPDLGPVGDGLISLMDQKLSKLDDRLYDLSSKISNSKRKLKQSN